MKIYENWLNLQTWDHWGPGGVNGLPIRVPSAKSTRQHYKADSNENTEDMS